MMTGLYGDTDEGAIETAEKAKEAYILEKANGLGMDIHPEITLSNDNPPVPYAVTIEGMCTPFARKQLSVYLHQNLGLSEEYQTWIS